MDIITPTGMQINVIKVASQKVEVIKALVRTF